MKVVLELMSLDEADQGKLLPAVIHEIYLDDSNPALNLEWFGIDGGLIKLDNKPCFVRGTKKSYFSGTGEVIKYLHVQELTEADIRNISSQREQHMEKQARQHAASMAGIQLVDSVTAKKIGLDLSGNSVVS